MIKSTRAVLYFTLAFMASETALAAPTDVSNVPLATSGGTRILPNLLFDLDDSGSMNWDFMPDYVSPNTGGVALTQSKPCMFDSNKGSTFCNPGDPPYAAGGSRGFNGVGYDPNFRYRPGVGTNGQPLLNPPTGLPLGNPVTTTLVPDDVYSHNPYGSSTTNVNLATQIPDMSYCNANNVCKRPGADTTGATVSGTAFDPANGTGTTMAAGQFPYRTNPANASTAIFGLPEMMSIASFARSGSTVTATTVEAHGLTTSDRVFVTGTSNVNVTCVPVTGATTNTFTYGTGSSGTVSATNGSYRKCVAGTWTISSGTVTVSTSPNSPGLVVGDAITAAPSASFSQGAFNVTAVGSTSFSYTSSTGTGPQSGFWVRTGLYNRGTQINGAAVAYGIVPVEYCSDPNLTNCVQVLPGNTPPAGFTLPAPVRFCQTQAQALAPGAVGDASGTPRCRSKYNETAGIPQYLYARYGWFQRDTIVASVGTYGSRQNRADCAAAPSCTYAEELNNYAIWYTYYRTRLQMMKSSVGIAFLPFIGAPTATPTKPNSIRLGFITMHAQDSGSVSASKYLRIQDFDTTQAANFYNKFYSNTASNATPLQEALSRAGWIFAGKLNTGLTSGIPTTDDPIQAACQRNYTLLTTDGYWNNLSSFPPQTLAGKTIGNLDASPATLLGSTLVDRDATVTLDGTGSSSTTFTPSGTTSEQVLCQGNNIANFPTLGGPTACGCQPKEHKIIQQDVQTGTLATFSNGVLVSSTTTTNQFYTNIAPGCVAGSWAEQDTPQTTLEDKICRRGTGGSVAVFSDGTTASCSSCSSNRFVLIRETKTQTQTVITTDGVQTQNNVVPGTTTYTYSTNGLTFSATAPSGGSCPSSAPVSTLSPNPQTNSGLPVNTSGTGTALAVWSPNPQTTTGGTPTSTFSAGGTPSTVADTALYFYQTKLRGGTDLNGDATGPQFGPNTTPPNTVDLSTNSIPVKSGAKDFVSYQHMVTFGIGMADGLLRFQPDYDTAASGDFFNIKNGTVGSCFWTTGSCNWPTPGNNTNANLDDLWHAAVNGRGQYYQALNADALSTGFSTVLTAVNAQVASASASATSSPNVTQTDNQIFSTTYETNTWSGSVFAQTIDPVSGNVNPTIQWQADPLLVARVSGTSDTRNILTFDTSLSGPKVKPFTWTSLTSTEQAFFSNKCGATPPPPAPLMGQCSGLGAADLVTANDGSQMVGYLRGWQANEGIVFRDRLLIDPVTGASTNTVLGDTITAKPVFVRNPILSYVDPATPGYSTYAANNANRAPRVYVAANDGMLHAFDGNTGAESWAYVPRFIMPGLFALADTGYGAKHQFFVDGSPETFDVFDSTANAWKTILIGGAGGGGRGFYALDITDPVNPKGLWEFCSDSTLCLINDADLGFAYGNPIVGKRPSDGKWVAVVTSGLNNVNPGGGSGVGFFYVLDAITGAILNKVSTGVGNSIAPSGLMKMSAFYNSALTDATMRFIYGSDQLGHLWRLDLGTPAGVCDAPATGAAPCVSHLAQLMDNSTPARAQPITTRPALTTIKTVGNAAGYRVLYVGTGRYLGDGLHGGVSDLSDPGATSGIAWLQTLYAIKDRNFDYGTTLRSSGNMVVQTLSLSGNSDRIVTKNPVNWDTNDGWLLDFIPIAADPSSAAGGERVNIDPRLILGTLVVATNTPAGGGTCSIGGSSRLYAFDYLTGGYIGNVQTVVGSFLGGTISVGMAIVQLPSSAIKDIITGADTSKTTTNVPPNSGGNSLKRFSYRER